MRTYYSPSTGLQYLESIHQAIPEDSIETTPEKHAELIEARGRGASGDVVGGVITVVEPVLSLADVQAREVAQVRGLANRRFERIDNIMRRAIVRLAKGQTVPQAMLDKMEKQDAIELAKDTAIAAINAATTKAEANAVVPAIVWP